VFHMVILERDKGGHKRNHGDDAEHPVHPRFREQGVVGGIVHKSDDPHPQVTESQVGRPLEQDGLGGPGQPSEKNHNNEEKRNLDQVGQYSESSEACQVLARNVIAPLGARLWCVCQRIESLCSGVVETATIQEKKKKGSPISRPRSIA